MQCVSSRSRNAMLPMQDRALAEAAETHMTPSAVANASAVRNTLLKQPPPDAPGTDDTPAVLVNMDDCHAVRFASRWMPIYAFALRYSVETTSEFESNALSGERLRYRRRTCDTRDADHARLLVLLANAFSTGAADAASMATPDRGTAEPVVWPQRMATFTGARPDDGTMFEGVELLAPEALPTAANDAYLDALCAWIPAALATMYRRWTLITGNARMRPTSFNARDSNTMRLVDFCNQTVHTGGLLAVRHVFSRDVANIIRLVDRIAWGCSSDGLASINATVATLHPTNQNPSAAQTVAVLVVQRRYVPTFLHVYEIRRVI